jgi:hypothetical protein
VRAAARYAAFISAGIVLALLVAFHATVVKNVLSTVAGLATGYSIAMGELRFQRGHVAVVDLHVARHGEPVLDAGRIDIVYDLRELLRGGTHGFGLVSVSVASPHLTIIRHKDLSLNIEVPKGGGNTPNLGPALFFTARVRDGSIEIHDPYNPSPQAHLLHLGGINVDANVDSGHRTHYRIAAGVLSAPTTGAVRTSPLAIVGTIDQDHRYAMHRITAADVPVAGFVDYFIDSPAARFLAGDVRDLDVRIFSLDTGATAPYHLGGSFRVEGIGARVIGIDGPVGHLRGKLYLTDNGILAPRIDADINGTPIVTGGGFFDFARPQFRIGVSGSADLRTMRGFFTFLQHEPVAGPVHFTTLIEGDVGKPLIFARVQLPAVSWGAFPFRAGHGLVAYYADEVTMAPLEAHFGPIDAVIRGGMALSNHIDSEFVANISGPGRALPYLDRVAPDMGLGGIAVVAGRDLPLHARGLLYGGGRGTDLSAFIAIDEKGRGEFGPIDFTRADGSEFSGSFTLDRPNSSSGFWAWMHHFRFYDPGKQTTLPGVTLPEFPTFGGVLDGAFAGGGAPSDFTLAGRVNGTGMEFLGIPVSSAAVDFGGTFRELRLQRIDARGAWGHIAGAGAVALPGAFVLRGTFDGTLQGLRRFTGDIGATGSASGPFAIAVDGPRIVVQTNGVRLHDASIHGIALDGFDGTLAVNPGGSLDLYGARARLGGGDVVAARTRTGGIAVAAANLPAKRLAAAGMPLSGGSLTFVGSAAVANGSPAFDGGVALSGGAYGGHHIDVTSGLGFTGSAVTVTAATAALDGQLGLVDGRVSGLGATPLLDLRTQVPAADLGRLASGTQLRVPYLTGSFGADVRIEGSSKDPHVDGGIAIPEGSVNGLHFGDAAAHIDGGLRALALRDGTVRVGTTTAKLAGSYASNGLSLDVRSDAVDLSDFNGFFDVGDMLAGRGRVALAYSSVGTPASTGNIALTGVRYRSFPLGSMGARWSSRSGLADAHLAMGGTTGSLAIDGTVSLARRRGTLLQSSVYDLRAKIADLDLGNWLPAVGLSYPLVTGKLDVDGSLRGQGNGPAIDVNASLSNATVGRIPIARASLGAHVTQQAITLENVAATIPHLDLTGGGTLGVAPSAALGLTLHGHSDNVGALAASVVHLPFAFSGAADADLHVTGTRATPDIAGNFALHDARAAGVDVPRVSGGFSLRGRSLVLQDTEVDFAKGAMVLSGSLPLTVTPFAIGPPRAPLAFDVDARAVDLSNFAAMLPKGSTIAGTLDGRFGVAGTASEPKLVGGVTLAKGALAISGATPLKNIAGTLSFDQQMATLDRFHADAGTGTLDASGRIAFPVGSSGLDYNFVATANHASVGVPGFFTGRLDGNVSLTRRGTQPLVGGAVSISDAMIPFNALFGAGAGIGGNSLIPTNLGFNLAVTAAKNVRVRSGAIDIGGAGTVNLTGTLGDPHLGGEFDASPGGTLVYFNRVFRVVRGSVRFNPNSGLVPFMRAEATTHVPNSDPDPSRNPSGYADITIDVSGSVTALNIELTSNPQYAREQILGLLLGASSIGAVNFGGTGSNPSIAGGTISGAPQVAISGLPPGLISQQNGTISVNQQAFGILNAQFTRSLLAPIENTLGGALGLTTLDLTVDYGGSVAFNARKQLGKGNFYAVYGQSLNYPLRQTFGLQAQPTPSLSFQFAGYTQYGLTQFGVYPLSSISTNQSVTAGQAPGGTSGFTFSIQRRYR